MLVYFFFQLVQGVNSSVIGFDDQFANGPLHLIRLGSLVDVSHDQLGFLLIDGLQHIQLGSWIYLLYGLDDFKTQRLHDQPE